MHPAIRYRVTGMDCPACAAKIKKALNGVGIDNPQVSVATQILTLEIAPDKARLSEAERAVTDSGYHLERLAGGAAQAPPPHMAPGYRRALWIVVVLNVGYGIIEMAGGILAGSQALKADALDFIGDGLITFLGILAIGWSLAWRARSALLQGIFLGVLGLGVLANTAYRVYAVQQVEPQLMGIVALVALVVNVAAALVLIPHRAGDANMRAVWLFSRNDAIGNAVVVLAAVLVAWTGSRWPDLIVAFIMAGLFIHAAQVIIRDARRDLTLVPR